MKYIVSEVESDSVTTNANLCMCTDLSWVLGKDDGGKEKGNYCFLLTVCCNCREFMFDREIVSYYEYI